MAALRAIPFVFALYHTEGTEVCVPVGYNYADFLQYSALIRQGAEQAPTLYNPFTTEPQQPRLILLYHEALGLLHRFSGIDPFWLLELSRIPLLFLFFHALWRFLVPVFSQTPDRTCACILVALSGGLEPLFVPLIQRLPPDLMDVSVQQLSPLLGWSTFQSANNPLWVAGLWLMLLVLGRALPHQDFHPRAALTAALLLLILLFTHPYSAIATAAIIATYSLLRLIFEGGGARPVLKHCALVLVPALAIGAVINRWQSGDAVFAKISGGLFGSKAIPVFWYPLTYGLLLVFAFFGWRHWDAARRHWLIVLEAWIAAIMLLHTSPLLNGYHYVYPQHIAICILAAPAAVAFFGRCWSGGASRKATAALAILALCASSLFVTMISVKDSLNAKVPAEFIQIARHLQTEPRGNVLAPPLLGTVLPAYVPTFVYAGHWFMTPEFSRRAEEYGHLLRFFESGSRDPAVRAEIARFIAEQRFRYIIVPAPLAAQARALIENVVDERQFTSLTLLVLASR